MTAIAVLGAQWGDEGKGKIAHLLSQEADWAVRFNGGTNAGHRVVFERVLAATGGSRSTPEEFRFHLIPSGALNPGCTGVLGNGMVIDPYALIEEIRVLRGARGEGEDEEIPLYFSQGAHLLMPYHPIVERLAGATHELDTTAKGIGPAYRDKAKRVGLRLGDLLFPEVFREKVERNLEWERRVWGAEAFAKLHPEALAEEILELMAPYRERIVDTAAILNGALDRGETVVFEGAQACLLDLDFGTYPYVTSSSATVGGIGVGAGVSPRRLDRVVGVTKAYTTRVGGGPFPTEEKGETGERLREHGGEYGTTTGRPRRCGWLDLVALRYACTVNAFTELAVMKLDVLSGLPELRVAVAYRYDGRLLEAFPTHPQVLAACRPVYETLPGWTEDLRACRALDELPENAQKYIQFIQDRVRCPITLISVGPHFAENILVR